MDDSAKRFLQRLDSYSRAFEKLEELVIAISNSSPSILESDESGLNVEIAREALIKRFEFTQELSWKVIKNYLIYEGETDIMASGDSYRRGLRIGIIDSDLWMDMISDRNLSSHDYNEIKATYIADRIITLYYPLLSKLLNDMKAKASEILKSNDDGRD